MSCDSLSPSLTVNLSELLPTGLISLLYLLSRSSYSLFASIFAWAGWVTRGTTKEINTGSRNHSDKAARTGGLEVVVGDGMVVLELTLTHSYSHALTPNTEHESRIGPPTPSSLPLLQQTTERTHEHTPTSSTSARLAAGFGYLGHSSGISQQSMPFASFPLLF